MGLLIPVSLLGTSVPLNVAPGMNPVPARNFTTCWQLCYFPLGIQGMERTPDNVKRNCPLLRILFL